MCSGDTYKPGMWVVDTYKPGMENNAPVKKHNCLVNKGNSINKLRNLHNFNHMVQENKNPRVMSSLVILIAQFETHGSTHQKVDVKMHETAVTSNKCCFMLNTRSRVGRCF